MKSARKWALTLGVVALVGAACNGATPTNTATPATGEGVTAAGQVAGTGSIPVSLQTIEGTAEDIIDVVPNDDWNQVAADVSDLTAAWRAYSARAKTDGASDALVSRFDGALNALETAADGHQAQETMQASNDLSAATIELYGLYDPVVPTDIGRLDVLGRQIVLDVAQPDWGATGTTMTELSSTWERVKSSILEHDGSDVATQFDANIRSLDKALSEKNSDAMTIQAKIALDIVDAMEGLY